MDKNHPYLETDNLNQIIDSFIENDKFQTNLENLIINALSNKKIITLSRSKIAEKIVSSDYIRLFEQDLLENILQSLDIEKIDRNELIIKNRNFPNKKPKENHEISASLDSLKIFNILVEEFLTCDDIIKLENYLGDLSNFESKIIIQCEKIDLILSKVSEFIISKQKIDDEIYLIPNLINFINKLQKNCATKVLIDSLTIFLSYFFNLVEKFYKGSFDITKFYKISLNLECLNNLMMKFYSDEIIVRKVDEAKTKSIVTKLFQILLFNYHLENPIYVESNKNSTSAQEFGISTNYILLLLFNLDKDMCSLKIFFRNSEMRKFIIENFEILENLPFINIISTYESFKIKNCFIWKHPLILEQIFPKKKITKKHIIYSWISIKLNFLGFTIRYKSLKNLFYKTFKEDEFNCFIHFTFILEFVIEMLFLNMESSAKEFFGDDFEFEAYQKENFFFLIKEILCDFLLYCNDKNCLHKKQTHIVELYNNQEYKENKMFINLLDDLFLALRENFNYAYIRNKEIEDTLRENYENENENENENINNSEDANQNMNFDNDGNISFDSPDKANNELNTNNIFKKNQNY